MQVTASDLRTQILNVDTNLNQVGRAYLRHLLDTEEHSSISNNLQQSKQVCHYLLSATCANIFGRMVQMRGCCHNSRDAEVTATVFTSVFNVPRQPVTLQGLWLPDGSGPQALLHAGNQQRYCKFVHTEYRCSTTFASRCVK